MLRHQPLDRRIDHLGVGNRRLGAPRSRRGPAPASLRQIRICAILAGSAGPGKGSSAAQPRCSCSPTEGFPRESRSVHLLRGFEPEMVDVVAGREVSTLVNSGPPRAAPARNGRAPSAAARSAGRRTSGSGRRSGSSPAAPSPGRFPRAWRGTPRKFADERRLAGEMASSSWRPQACGWLRLAKARPQAGQGQSGFCERAVNGSLPDATGDPTPIRRRRANGRMGRP